MKVYDSTNSLLPGLSKSGFHVKSHLISQSIINKFFSVVMVTKMKF